MTTRYRPLDNLLSKPRVRVLRTLKRFGFDDVSSADLHDALDAHNKPAKLAIWRALETLVPAGFVERRVEDGTNYYRITKSGLDELAAILAKGEVNESSAYPRRSSAA